MNGSFGRNSRIALQPIHTPPSSRLPHLDRIITNHNSTSVTTTSPPYGAAVVASGSIIGSPLCRDTPPPRGGIGRPASMGVELRDDYDDDDEVTDVVGILPVSGGSSFGDRLLLFHHRDRSPHPQSPLITATPTINRSLLSSPTLKRPGRSVSEFGSSSVSLPPITESVHAAPLYECGSPESDMSMSSSSTRFRRRKNLPFPIKIEVGSSNSTNTFHQQTGFKTHTPTPATTGQHSAIPSPTIRPTAILLGGMPLIPTLDDDDDSNINSPYTQCIHVPSAMVFQPKLRGALVDVLDSNRETPSHTIQQQPDLPPRSPLLFMRTTSLPAPRYGNDLQLEDICCKDDSDAVDPDEDYAASRSPDPSPHQHKY